MEPKIIKGSHNQDARGTVFYNNEFNASSIKRVYALENCSTDFIRAWQGHQIEQRWFSAIIGSFRIKLIKIDRWENPSVDLETTEFVLTADHMDILHVPKGYVSSIQALEEQSKLLLFADYLLGEINDEYRFSQDYFK